MQVSSHGQSIAHLLPFLAALLSFPAGRAGAEEAIPIREDFAVGSQYRVSSRLELAGQLTRPAEKGKAAETLTVTGSSALDYDERVLGVTSDGRVDKTVRVFRRVDFERKVGGQPQKTTIRPAVRRLVVLRHKNAEVPFCPEGPLTWNEIDIVRTDVFTPALAGLLPDKPVRPGDAWTATTAAVQELTDLEVLEDGKLDCKLEGFVTLEKRRHARVSFAGTVRGPDEDGISQHKLEGYFYFDLESNHLSYLSLKGVQSPLHEGKEVGRVEGQFVLTRQAHTTARELSDEALKGLTLKETEENTLLLYDNPDLGLRFLYPRRWRLAGGLGGQVRLDGKDGSGLQISLDAPSRVPSAAAFLNESRQFFASRKAKLGRFTQPRRVEGPGRRELENFTQEVEMDGRALLMDYYVLRQAEGGATIAAGLPAKDAAALRKEVERIARSVTITRALK